jgi:hypothetical protein
VRQGIILVIAALSLGLAGCDDQAKKFAEQTKALLDQRSEQLAAKIAAETAAYKKSAANATENQRALVDSTLRNERNERTDELAADYSEGRKPVSLWRKHIAEYAKIDFTQNRDLLAADMQSETRYLRKFEDLKVEKEKVDGLAKLLDALSKKRTLKEDVDALSGFSQDTKLQFDIKVCTHLNAIKGTTSPEAQSALNAYGAMRCDTILKPAQ